MATWQPATSPPTYREPLLIERRGETLRQQVADCVVVRMADGVETEAIWHQDSNAFREYYGPPIEGVTEWRMAQPTPPTD